RLENFFNFLNIPVRIIGDKNNPAVIYKELVCLSAYVHNFNLNFTNVPFEGKVVHSEKLTYKINTNRNEILSIIKNNIHRPIYNIKIKNQDLFLAGYNFLDRQQSVGKYPVFARHNYKIYFSLNYAENIVDNYIKEGYQLEIWKPFKLDNEIKILHEN
ncbi:MAG: hypothetical protein ACC656_11055, partial [Candidatus Heimdallarchaeota archaeon]